MKPGGDREAFAHALLADSAADETEFFREYVKAAGHKGSSGRLGPEWGMPEAASFGPAIVAVGLFLFDVFKSWVGEVPKKTVEGFLVDRGKERLKAWLGSPKKAEVSAVVTAKGRAEIMSILGWLVAEAKLPPSDAERLTRRVAGYLFGDDAGKN